MRNSILFLLGLLLLCSCDRQQSPESIQWEYEVVEMEGSKLPQTYSPNDQQQLLNRSAFLPLEFRSNSDIISMLNHWGKEGWELVDVYTTTETVFPNFGDENLHTGIKANTRTKALNFVFKRQLAQ